MLADVVILLLSAVAALVSVLLLRPPRALPGCGPRSGCDAVTSSRWSRLGPVPVALPGGIVFVVILASSITRLVVSGLYDSVEVSLLVCAPMALGAAIWFSALQLLILRRFCPYCMVIHAAGAVAGLLILLTHPLMLVPLVAGSSCLLLFVVLQVLIRPTLYHLVSTESLPDSEPSLQPSPALAMAPLHLDSGRVSINRQDWPFLGSPTAHPTLALLFDVTCHDCRDLYRSLLHAIQASPEEFAVVVIPVPMTPACNPGVQTADRFHPDSCDYARLTLALWNTDRVLYREYESWMLGRTSLPPLFEARSLASRVLGAARLTLALAGPSVESGLLDSVAVYHATQSAQLPQLLLPHGILQGMITIPELRKVLSQQEVTAAPTSGVGQSP